jgi:HAMP domain-containing protein
MRISTITNWAYAVTVVLTVLSAGAFLLSADAGVRERRAVEEHLALNDLGEELALGAEERTDQAMLYVMQGSTRYLDAFRIDEGEELRRETATRNIRLLEPSAAELTALDQVETDAAALDQIEEKAVAAFGDGDRAGAQTTLFGADHDHVQTTLLADVQLFRQLTDARTLAALNNARVRNDWYAAAAKAVLALTGSVFLAVLYFVLRRRVAMPLMRMTKVVKRLAKQDYAVELPADSRRDEIGEMNDAIQVFRTNGLERDRLDAERHKDQLTKDFILQMMHRLQACQTQGELADTVARFVPQIFPGLPGHLYVLNTTRATLTLVGSWLNPPAIGRRLSPQPLLGPASRPAACQQRGSRRHSLPASRRRRYRQPLRAADGPGRYRRAALLREEWRIGHHRRDVASLS